MRLLIPTLDPQRGQRYEWESGDVIYIAPRSQHFNATATSPCVHSAINRIFKASGWNSGAARGRTLVHPRSFDGGAREGYCALARAAGQRYILSWIH